LRSKPLCSDWTIWLGFASDARWGPRHYEISLYFLALPNAETAILRVAARVKQGGGHNIPESVIRRRFTAGLHNFENIYKPEVDHWIRLDNARDVIESNAPIIRGALAAWERAAQDARHIAIQTGTELIVIHNGKICLIPPNKITEMPLLATPTAETERVQGTRFIPSFANCLLITQLTPLPPLTLPRLVRKYWSSHGAQRHPVSEGPLAA
jgi:hypothetical protein